jgi:hypothetical protein
VPLLLPTPMLIASIHFRNNPRTVPKVITRVPCSEFGVPCSGKPVLFPIKTIKLLDKSAAHERKKKAKYCYEVFFFAR